MEPNETALAPLGALAAAGGVDDPYPRELFAALRRVFDASRLKERVVFWIEEKAGHFIVRYVRDSDRTRKSEDKVVGKTILDLAAVKILIGNYAADCSMTTVRWEIYGDFALQDQLAVGRFDWRDLLGNASRSEVQNFQSHGVVPAGNWDFDNIYLVHCCPNCSKVFDKTSILYVSHRPCQSCKQKTSLDQSLHIVRKLLMSLKARDDKFQLWPCWSTAAEFPIDYFVDPTANSVVYWAVEHNLILPEMRAVGLRPDINALFELAYERSLFRMLVAKEIRSKLLDHLTEDEVLEWELVIACAAQVGAVMGMFEKPETFEVEQCRRGVTSVSLPLFINTLIMRHGAATERSQPCTEACP